jgi:hypothetical protein
LFWREPFEKVAGITSLWEGLQPVICLSRKKEVVVAAIIVM